MAPKVRAALAPEAYDPAADAMIFRLAMPDAVATSVMPAIVAQIERSAALADLRVMPLTTRDPRPLLERGDADLAIGSYPDTVASLQTQGTEAARHRARLHGSGYAWCARATRSPTPRSRSTRTAPRTTSP